MKEMDLKALEFVKNLDSWGFIDYVESNNITICGARAISCLLEICKLLKCSSVEVLKYYTSGDISNDYSNSVGYSSVVIK